FVQPLAWLGPAFWRNRADPSFCAEHQLGPLPAGIESETHFSGISAENCQQSHLGQLYLPKRAGWGNPPGIAGQSRGVMDCELKVFVHRSRDSYRDGCLPRLGRLILVWVQSRLVDHAWHGASRFPSLATNRETHEIVRLVRSFGSRVGRLLREIFCLFRAQKQQRRRPDGLLARRLASSPRKTALGVRAGHFYGRVQAPQTTGI